MGKRSMETRDDIGSHHSCQMCLAHLLRFSIFLAFGKIRSLSFTGGRIAPCGHSP